MPRKVYVAKPGTLDFILDTVTTPVVMPRTYLERVISGSYSDEDPPELLRILPGGLDREQAVREMVRAYALRLKGARVAVSFITVEELVYLITFVHRRSASRGEVYRRSIEDKYDIIMPQALYGEYIKVLAQLTEAYEPYNRFDRTFHVPWMVAAAVSFQCPLVTESDSFDNVDYPGFEYQKWFGGHLPPSEQ